MHTVRTCEWQRKKILKLVFILPSIWTTNFIIFGNFQKNITWFQKNVNLQKMEIIFLYSAKTLTYFKYLCFIYIIYIHYVGIITPLY